MRTLKFIVDGLVTKKNPECNFNGLIQGTKGYLQAEFSFSPEWKDCIKVAAFYSCNGENETECEPQILKDGNKCTIPDDALKGRKFKVQAFGKNKDLKLLTTTVTVVQDSVK